MRGEKKVNESVRNLGQALNERFDPCLLSQSISDALCGSRQYD